MSVCVIMTVIIDTCGSVTCGSDTSLQHDMSLSVDVMSMSASFCLVFLCLYELWTLLGDVSYWPRWTWLLRWLRVCVNSWEGSGVNEVGRDKATGIIRVRVNPKYYRPTEVVSVPIMCWFTTWFLLDIYVVPALLPVWQALLNKCLKAYSSCESPRHWILLLELKRDIFNLAGYAV